MGTVVSRVLFSMRVKDAYLSLARLDVHHAFINGKWTHSGCDISTVAGHVKLGTSDRYLDECVIYIGSLVLRW